MGLPVIASAVVQFRETMLTSSFDIAIPCSHHGESQRGQAASLHNEDPLGFVAFDAKCKRISDIVVALRDFGLTTVTCQRDRSLQWIQEIVDKWYTVRGIGRASDIFRKLHCREGWDYASLFFLVYCAENLVSSLPL